MLHQKHNDPFVAVVVDHVASIANSKIELGAFRILESNYDSLNQEKDIISQPNTRSFYTSAEKPMDYGACCSPKYYSLSVEYFAPNFKLLKSLSQENLDAILMRFVTDAFEECTVSQVFV